MRPRRVLLLSIPVGCRSALAEAPPAPPYAHRYVHALSADLPGRKARRPAIRADADRALLLGVEWFRGQSANGRFYRRKVEWTGLGLHLFL